MRLPFKVGLKLYSINTDLILEAESLWHKDFFQYIELYTIPGSYSSTHKKWQTCHIPFVIHAPHSLHGMNLSWASQWEQNLTRFKEAQEFADMLNVDRIVVHGGHTGSIVETIRQVGEFSDSRVFLENKPKVGINNEACVGWSPDEFQLASASGVFKGFVLDFGHAACAALSVGKRTMDFVNEFIKFKPGIFHLSDGDCYSEKDTHYHLGTGTLALKKFVCVVPKDSYLTLEVPLDSEEGLQEFVEDVHVLGKIANSILEDM